MSGTLTAQYRGTCTECPSPIEPGQQIVRASDSTFVDITYRHAACPETAAERADREALSLGRCSACGLNHRGEC